jgi:hypothetical protein
MSGTRPWNATSLQGLSAATSRVNGAAEFDLNPFEKVAEAARALRRSDDPRLQAALTDLRNLWITVANEGDLATATRLVEEVASIERLHADLIRQDALIFQ